MSICPQSEELSPPSLFTVVRGRGVCLGGLFGVARVDHGGKWAERCLCFG